MERGHRTAREVAERGREERSTPHCHPHCHPHCPSWTLIHHLRCHQRLWQHRLEARLPDGVQSGCRHSHTRIHAHHDTGSSTGFNLKVGTLTPTDRHPRPVRHQWSPSQSQSLPVSLGWSQSRSWCLNCAREWPQGRRRVTDSRSTTSVWHSPSQCRWHVIGGFRASVRHSHSNGKCLIRSIRLNDGGREGHAWRGQGWLTHLPL